MRTKTSMRAWLAGIWGGATVSAGLLAAGEQPPPYPSVSPVLPAMLPPTPVVPGSEVKPAAATEPIPKATPAVPTVPGVPTVDTPKPAAPATEVLPLPSVPSVVPSPVVAVPTLTPPVIPPAIPTPTVAPPVNVTTPAVTLPTVPATPKSVPSIPATPVIPKPAETSPAPAPTKVVDIPLATATKPAEVKSVPEGKPTAVPTDTKPAPGTVKISIGATPGVLDNVGKLDAALGESKAAYGKVHDYSCHFIRQERVRGKLTPDVIHELHVRTSPLAIYTKAVQPKDYAGVEIVSVAGKFATNQVRYKPNGGTFLTVSAEDPRAATGRHPADHVGLAAVLGTVERMLSTERKLGHPVVVTVGAYSYAGKPVMRYEVLCEKPHAHRYCHRAVLFVDRETNLPVRFEAYDEPRGTSGPGGDLLESYSFVNLKLNVGHAAAVFDR
jgi:hypothetical protein